MTVVGLANVSSTVQCFVDAENCGGEGFQAQSVRDCCVNLRGTSFRMTAGTELCQTCLRKLTMHVTNNAEWLYITNAPHYVYISQHEIVVNLNCMFYSLFGIIRSRLNKCSVFSVYMQITL